MTVAKRKKSPLTRDALRRLAGPTSYERGEAYAAGGRVGEIAEDGGHITAFVRGELRYKVSLWCAKAPVTYKCSCPIGLEGACCKHCVALGLVWLDRAPGAAATSTTRAANSKATAKKRTRAERPLTVQDVRAHLAAQPADSLVDLLMQHAMRDDTLRQRLLLDTAKATRTGVNRDTYRRAIDSAVDVGDYVPYQEASGYFERIDRVLSSIAELSDTHPAAVIELTEYALTRMEQAIQSIDDSDGGTGEVLERMHQLHFAACNKARPDPEALARTLFEREMESEWDVFSGAVLRYHKLLGTTGLVTYRALAEAAWKRVPVLRAGDQMRRNEDGRFRITQIMVALSTLAGDVEARVTVLQRDLSFAYQYVVIAELYEAAGKRDSALHWAEQGVAAFPDRTDSRLRGFLVTQYERRGRHAEAMSLLWKNFEDQQALEHYVALHAGATRAGKKRADASCANDWITWRDKALSAIRASMSARDGSRNMWHAIDGALLVQIFMWEKDHEAAWREAQVSGCNDSLWMDLAKLREQSHPADAVGVYQRAVARVLAQTNTRTYPDAVSLLRMVARVMKSANDSEALREYLTVVRTRHKAKRNFIRLLDAAKL